ncbi:T9SS type A sorting domain-containing protein [Tunicatimonas pelagia]|uniref:T9SS type A sorting domain-containing protein n=1 Tax=Tunicatimonas pelagia TaxID=931531 RepID=UPI0026654D6B|nr:T9SS type A sorting domain-containing protein [Tunicatimonas pelagia]WKN45463.1 T9SS type A sorting domain-containing protein [Tunicatimonas pelagia]
MRRKQRHSSRMLAGLFLLLAAVAPGWAQTYVSPSDNLTNLIKNANGGTFILGAGTYEPLYLDGEKFTKSNPLVLKAATGANVKIRSYRDGAKTRCLQLNNASYMVFEGIHFTESGYEGVWLEHCDHIIFKDCEVSKTGLAGIKIALRSKYIDILNCYIYDTGVRDPCARRYGEGIYLGRGSKHSTENWPDLTEFVWIEGCRFNETGAGEAINVKGEVFNTTIRNNRITNVTLQQQACDEQANEGAISLDHTATLNGKEYNGTTWRKNWVENNVIDGVRAGRNVRIAGIYSAGTGNYIINNTIKNVRTTSINSDKTANGIRLNNWSSDDLRCYVWNNTLSNVEDSNVFGSLAIQQNPGPNPNRPQSWYSGTTNPPTTNDVITSVTSPNTVSPGQTVAVRVNYTAATERDLIVLLQRDSSPFTSYAAKRVTVSAGSRSTTVNITVNANTPVANDAYQFQTFITTKGGDWGQRLDNNVKKDVDCVAGDSNPSPGNIVIRAKGSCGSEQMVLKVNGSPVRTWNNVSATTTNYTYSGYSGGTVQVHFTNDATNVGGCIDRNLRVERVTVCGTVRSGTRVGNSGTSTDLWSNGYFDYGNPGCSNARVASNQKKTGLTSFHDAEIAPLQIYPNPASTMLTLNGESDYTVAIMDISGRVLLRRSHVSGRYQLDIQGLAPGGYIVEYQSSSGTTTKRLLIERE